MKVHRYLIMVMSFILAILPGCSTSPAELPSKGLGNGWQAESRLELQYAKNFNVDYYQGGYALISLSDGSRYLVVPQGVSTPQGIDQEITVLQQPIDNIYLVATSAMCLFDALDALDQIYLSGTKQEDWYIPNAKAAMEAGAMLYAGKYSAPDYELIMTSNCDLSIQSTMINHVPEVHESLKKAGIPVLTDLSSYETHPLGRTEWIKLYGVLTGKEATAKEIFDQQVSYMDSVADQGNTGKTVAFFYISSSGYVVARKSGDYVTKMIELAGGNYIFKDLGDPEQATSTVKVEMEKFYTTAKDADYIIYNSTIGGELSSIQELITKSPLLSEFKAVKNGNVWCTGKNLYQETTQLGLMISDMHRMLTEDDLTRLNYLYKLQ